MKFTSPRATFEETLAFANAVREAGGGAPLDALMPAVPADSTKCLIAKNLNFNCMVAVRGNGRWQMTFEDKETRDKVAEKLGLKALTDWDQPGRSYFNLLLPKEIGQVAADFDEVNDLAELDPDELDVFDKQMIADFMPYIEASCKDAYDAAYVINEDGSIL